MVAVVRRVRKWRLLEMATFGAAFGLGSCALLSDSGVETPPAPPATAEAPAVDMTPAPPPPPRPARKPAPPAPGTGSAAEPTETVDPTRVIGLDQPGTADWLGEPSQRTEAPPATIWRYVSSDCEIDVYFYLDMQHRIMRALHYEVRSNDIVERRPQQCFQQLVDEHQRNSNSASYRPR
jgi:hypothetical protein